MYFLNKFIQSNKIKKLKIVEKYEEYFLKPSNEKKIEILNLLAQKNINPSLICRYYKNFLHSDIEIIQFSITEISRKITTNLNNYFTKNNLEFLRIKEIVEVRKEIYLYSQYLSFLAYNLNLAVLYNFFGLKINIYFTLERDSETNFSDDEKKIILLELENFAKNYKNIIFINLENENETRLNQNIKNKIKLNSFKDVIAHKQSYTFRKNDTLKDVSNQIKDKSNLKFRYRKNLKLGKKIFNLIYNNQFWIIHNSNMVESGVVQILINEKKCSFSSYEYIGQNDKKIMISKESEILKFDNSLKINDFYHKYKSRLNRIEEGKVSLDLLYNSNFDKNKITKFLEKNSIIKKYPNEKKFLLLANSLIDSRFINPNSHTIFDNFEDFLIKTVKKLTDLDCITIIKYHPVDIFIFKKYENNIEDIIIKNKLNSEKVIFVKDDSIDSYSLSNLFDNIIVYASNIGNEMIALNKNVITCGEAFYLHLNLGLNPKNQHEYNSIIEKITNNQLTKNSLSNDDLVKCYLYQNYLDTIHSKEFIIRIGDSSNQLNSNIKKFISLICQKNEVTENPFFELII